MYFASKTNLCYSLEDKGRESMDGSPANKRAVGSVLELPGRSGRQGIRWVQKRAGERKLETQDIVGTELHRAG